MIPSGNALAAKVRNGTSLVLAISAVVAGYALLVASFSNRGFPDSLNDGRYMPYLADKPVGDDGFYALTVAWNIASGNGVTYNHGKETTGFQPLFVFLVTPIAYVVQKAGGDKFDFVRSVIVFGALNLIAVAHLFGLIAKKAVRARESRSSAYY